MEAKTRGIGMKSIPNMNKAAITEDNKMNNLSLVPFLLKEKDRQCTKRVDVVIEVIVPESRQLVRLFGFEIEPNGGVMRAIQEIWGRGEENVMLFMTSGDGEELAKEWGDSSLCIYSDLFNLAPFIFGIGLEHGFHSGGKVARRHKFRQSKSKCVILLELGKMGHREKEEIGLLPATKRRVEYGSMHFIAAVADRDQPHRVK